MGNFSNRKNKKRYLNDNIMAQLRYKLYIHRRKWMLLVEDFIGADMSYVLLRNSRGVSFGNFWWFRENLDLKNDLIEGRTDKIEKLIQAGKFGPDEIIDYTSGQRLIHYAVIFDDRQLVEFLINKDAHLMARDWKGYTALLKASSLGRLEISKMLVEAGVSPNHKDPWGVTPLDKAQLYQQEDLIDYFQRLGENFNKEKISMWKNKTLNEKINLTPWYMWQF